MAARTKVIIDCDTGVDDAVAILLALADSNTDVLAITCVNGNSTVDQAVHNTLITLQVANRKVPVYRGCSKPLSIFDLKSPDVHAADGLSGVSQDYSPAADCLQPGHAANALVEIVNKYPGEVILIALGPLTNLALAYRLDEKFSSKLKRLVIMGGNTEGKGNSRLGAEFNFATDPEAAQIVVEETVCDQQICGWETCGLNNTMPFHWYENWVQATSPTAEFIKKITFPFYVRKKKLFPGIGFALCDPIAVAVALNSDIILQSIYEKATVEKSGINTRGMMVLEWKKGLFPRETKPPEIVLKLDMAKYVKMLEDMMSSP